MNNYITLYNATIGSMKFMCPFKMWEPVIEKPMNVRYTWDGVMDVTYGPSAFRMWEGNIRAPVTPGTGWGSVSDIRNFIETMAELVFTDHYGTAYVAHIMPNGPEKSVGPMWSGASNAILFGVRIIASGLYYAPD